MTEFLLHQCKVANSLHEAFQLHGYENYEQCIQEAASSSSSYLSDVPSEVLKIIINYANYTTEQVMSKVYNNWHRVW